MEQDVIVLVKGAGEMASGISHRLTRCRFKVCMTEIPEPHAVRREVSFCEAIHDGKKTVEGLTAVVANSYEEIVEAWRKNYIPVIIDPEATIKDVLNPAVLVDAILAKKNLGTRITDAPLVIGVGPGFGTGKDVHLVVETNRGHNLGRVISQGEAEENTGIPGVIAGFSIDRVLRAPRDGTLQTVKHIGDLVEVGDVIGSVEGMPIQAGIKGVIRGLLRDGTTVWKEMKAGDIDPRGIKGHCYTISDKARAVGGGVLEAILSHLNRRDEP
jgi:xanthine dehydrogenase accessory factor